MTRYLHLYSKARSATLFLASVLLSAGGIASATDLPNRNSSNSTGVTLASVASEALPGDPAQTLTAFVVKLAPEAKTGSHRHAGIVFVYVLEGIVRSH